MLTDVEIDQLVQRYTLEMARYEEAALAVEAKLRRELRSAAIPVLLSSRAKHPEDLRGKLRLKRDDVRYEIGRLASDLNKVVHDLAGCRVVVYDPRHEDVAAGVVRKSFRVTVAAGADEQHRKDTGYRATHVLVEMDGSERFSLGGAVIEVQVTSIACHVFNELEHDIRYKERGVSPGARVLRNLEDLQHASRLLDNVVERLMDERKHEVAKSRRAIEDTEELRVAIERILDRPVVGEVARLYRLLAAVLDPLTVHALETLDLPQRIEAGRAAGPLKHVAPDDVDDIVALAIDLSREFPSEFQEIVSAWRGPSTALKRAILEVTHA